MKPSALALLLIASCVMPGAATGAALVEYLGLSWESGAFPPSIAGDMLEVVSTLDDVDAPLTWDPQQFQYTLYITGLTALGEVPLDAQNILAEYSGGTFGIYEDPIGSGTPADPGTNPPNATAPSTYADGVDFLSGFFTSFSIEYNVTTNAGAFEGVATFTGGSHLGELGNATQGFTFGGVFQQGAPPGYDLQWDGFVLLDPVVVERTTWGEIKTQFRAELTAGH